MIIKTKKVRFSELPIGKKFYAINNNTEIKDEYVKTSPLEACPVGVVFKSELDTGKIALTCDVLIELN